MNEKHKKKNDKSLRGGGGTIVEKRGYKNLKIKYFYKCISIYTGLKFILGAIYTHTYTPRTRTPLETRSKTNNQVLSA